MYKLLNFFSLSLVALLLVSCSSNGQTRKLSLTAPKGKAVAAFAEGCFWCSEHIFESVVGIDSAVSGYAGGKTTDPTYEKVNTETTGHAETVLVYYNPKVISYSELVKIFFASHDPTTPNQQGPDRGSSYRSILFYSTAAEKAIAEQSIKDLSASNRFKKGIVTDLMPLKAFYRAEEYHQDYIEHNPNQPYVKSVSIPRYNLFKQTYKGKYK